MHRILWYGLVVVLLATQGLAQTTVTSLSEKAANIAAQNAEAAGRSASDVAAVKNSTLAQAKEVYSTVSCLLAATQYNITSLNGCLDLQNCPASCEQFFSKLDPGCTRQYQNSTYSRLLNYCGVRSSAASPTAAPSAAKGKIGTATSPAAAPSAQPTAKPTMASSQPSKQGASSSTPTAPGTTPTSSMAAPTSAPAAPTPAPQAASPTVQTGRAWVWAITACVCAIAMSLEL